MLKFIIVIFLLLLLPFPIIIKFIYSKEKKILYIYFFKINLNKANLDKGSLKKSNKVKQKKTSKKQISYKKIPLLLNKIKRFYLIKSITFDIYFGLDDAANTALLYGLICSLQGFLYHAFKNYLNIKNYSLHVTPKLNGKILNIKANSIIFISFAKIILMVFLIKHYLKDNKKNNNL